MHFRASSVLVVVTLLIGCGGDGTSSAPVSPTGPPLMSGVCRNYASSVTATTTTTFTGQNPSVATQDTTTSYNTATNQLLETGTGMSNNGICRRSVSWSTNYGSVADFVDEVSVIPPKTRWASQSGMATYSGPSGPCANRTSAAATTISYDSQGRLVVSVSTGGVGPRSLVATSLGNNNVYTAWDVFGRQTAYGRPDSFGALNHISYDDSARTRSTAYYTAPTTTVDTFDSNGNLVRSLTVTRVPPRPITGGGGVQTADTTVVIHATRRVCR
jgi:hypothetical protein